ncbi:MAG: hypothetical protein ACI9C2_001097 [Gammaproteobacteria bacterium]|jgi:hypothetical protein
MFQSNLPGAVACLAITCLFSTSASAQLNDQWTSFTAAPALINAPVISSSTFETDLAWGDLDKNGLVDLVVARVQPIMAGGRRPNMLLMNEGGVLTDRTATLAVASDVAGDQGFLTPTADRDVVLADVNGDGWLDVITAVGFGLVSQPKRLSHPRVYLNLGEDLSGTWLGLRYEEARIPTLISFVSGLAVAARFNAVAAGDVDGDGDVDLYFADHDASPANPFGGESATLDTDDRLFLNDGNGFFTDASMIAMTPSALDSNYSNTAVIADFDGDGVADIAKQTNGVPGGAAATVAYGNAGPTASFTNQQTAHASATYAISTGDLNSDGRLDMIVSSNNIDGIVYNTGSSGGQATWSSLVPFDFLSGSDDSFAANSLAADLDGDGLEDVLIADVDPQITGFNRRLHIYHNRGNQGGSQALLREERELSGAGGWVGAPGLTEADLKGTHDIAVFDVNGDGVDDLIISRSVGTQVWTQDPWCQTDLGSGTAGIDLTICGEKFATGSEVQLKLQTATPNTGGFLLLATSANPTFIPEIMNTVVAWPPVFFKALNTDASGEINLTVGGGGAPGTIVVQFLMLNGLPSLLSPSNAVEVTVLP